MAPITLGGISARDFEGLMPFWDPRLIMQAYGCIVSDESLAPIPHVRSLTEASGPHAILGSLSKHAAHGGLQVMKAWPQFRMLPNYPYRCLQ